MLIYSGTGKTKLDEQRVSRSIGALLISSPDCSIDELSNETITVFVERANGSNTPIATNVNLKAFILASTFGESAVNIGDGTSFSALCEICEDGAIMLHENEGIKVSMSNLKSAKTYSVNGIEYPLASPQTVSFDTKKVLSDEISRKFDVDGYDKAVIQGFSALEEVHFTFMNGNTAKYTKEEIKAISHDVDPVTLIGTDKVKCEIDSDTIVTQLVGVVAIDVYKSAGNPVTITLKEDVFDYAELYSPEELQQLQNQ